MKNILEFATVFAVGTFLGRLLFWGFVILVVSCTENFEQFEGDVSEDPIIYSYAALPQEVTHES